MARAALRLLPVNALIALLRPNDLWPPLLWDRGLRLVGLEIPMTTDAGVTVLDVVALHEPTNLLLVAECKSGANVDQDQATKLSRLDPAGVVRAASVTLVSDLPPVIETAYVCLHQHASRIQRGLDGASIAAPILAVAPARIEHRGEPFVNPPLTDWPNEVDLPGPPPRIVRFDAESTSEELVASVLSELVAAQSHQRPIMTVRALTEAIIPEYALYGRREQTVLGSRVDAAARHVAQQQPENFRYRPRTQGQGEAAVEILRSPEDRDPRGRTQAYQAIARRSPRHRRPKPPPEGQLELDLVSEELDRLADADDHEEEDS